MNQYFERFREISGAGIGVLVGCSGFGGVSSNLGMEPSKFELCHGAMAMPGFLAARGRVVMFRSTKRWDIADIYVSRPTGEVMFGMF